MNTQKTLRDIDQQSDESNRRIQVIVGGLVFLIALIVYSVTVAPTTSYWDCGEFIACSYRLGVMHPPGAPLYLLIGRIMTMLPFFGNIGLRVNMFSVIISAATVLLTFLIIIQLIRRWRGKAKTWEDHVILYAGGALGALALAFTDGFWFNAVEAEVYAFSMFFTALVVWLALYWGERSERAGSLLIIFFIFYLFGLAAGVHLLNILAFPFVLIVAFFHENSTVRRLLLLLFVQVSVPILLYVIFYQFNPSTLSYQQFVTHQSNAWKFLQWFGGFWIIGTLVYIFVKDRSVFNAWWILPALVVLGYSTYLVIYIRAGLAPPINMNNPSSLEAMKDYLGRKQYGEQSMLLTFLSRQADFWNYQIQKMYTRYFGWQFIGKGVLLDTRNRIVEIISFRGLYGLPFLVGLWGAVYHFIKDRKRAIAVLMLFVLTGIAIVVYLNQPDPQPRERDYSYVGSFFAFALWIGIGSAGIFEWIAKLSKDWQQTKKVIFIWAGLILLAVVPLNLLAFNYNSHDRSGNYVAWDYSYNILQTCEPDAIIFTGGDNDTYPLWYLQEVEGIRRDVRVICLALMNSSWYMRQLRDQKPKVPINLNDETLAGMGPRVWKTSKVKIPVPEQVRRREMEKLREGEDFSNDIQLPDSIVFTLTPTFPPQRPRALRAQDLMVIRILQENRWSRPIYFALTVANADQIGLDRYLRMDGLALKLIPYPVREIDPDRLEENILEKYQYRGLDDPGIYFNLDAIRLLSNSRQTFLKLARYYTDRGQNDKAVSILKAMEAQIPEAVIPYADERVALTVAYHYHLADAPGEHEKRLQYVMPGKRLNRRSRFNLARFYAQEFQDWERAEALYQQLIEEDRNDVEAYSELLQVYSRSQQYRKGITLLESWLMHHPGDGQARRELERLKGRAESESSTDSLARKPAIPKE